MSDVRELIGCLYAEGGNAPAEGFDCYGLLKYARAQYFGLATPLGGGAVTSRNVSPGAVRAIERAAAGGEWRQVAPPGRAGDCVLLGRRRATPPTHVGVALPAGVLHAFRGDTGLGGSVVLTPWRYVGLAFPRVEVWTCSQRCS